MADVQERQPEGDSPESDVAKMQKHIQENKTIIHKLADRPDALKNIPQKTYWFVMPALGNPNNFRIRFINDEGNLAEITIKNVDVISTQPQRTIGAKVMETWDRATRTEQGRIERVLQKLGYQKIAGPTSEAVKKAMTDTWHTVRGKITGVFGRRDVGDKDAPQPSDDKPQGEGGGAKTLLLDEGFTGERNNLRHDIEKYKASLKAINSRLNDRRNLGDVERQDYERQKNAFEKQLKKAEEKLKKLR